MPPDLPPPPPHTTARTVWKERDPLPLCLAAQHQHATEPHSAPAGGGEMFSGPGSRIAKQGQEGVNVEVRGTPWILTHRIFLLPAPGLMKHVESHTHTHTHTHTQSQLGQDGSSCSHAKARTLPRQCTNTSCFGNNKTSAPLKLPLLIPLVLRLLVCPPHPHFLPIEPSPAPVRHDAF